MSIATYPKYGSYRNSDIDWIPKLPSHWCTQRSKFLFKQSKELARKGDIQLSATQSHSVIPQADYEAMIGRKVTQIQTNLEKRKHVEVDDFVISMRSFQGGLERAKAVGCIRSSYVILKPSSLVCPDFYAYLLKMPQYIQALQLTSNFIRDGQDLNFENFSDVDLFVPPLSEQRAIAAFLDEKCAKVNEAVRIKEEQITLLRERRQILIQQAVTRGLNPAVPMKDSGIDWICQIPAHWDMVCIKRLARLIQTGPFGTQLHAHDYVTGGIPLVNPKHMKNGVILPDENCSVDETIRSRLNKYCLNEFDLIMARRGELGRCAVVTFKESGWLCGTGSLMIRFNLDRICVGYLYWIIASEGTSALLSMDSVGSTMDNLNTSIIGNIIVPVPPIKEQRAIVAYIDDHSQKIDTAITIKQSQITTLKEYKTCLINAAVTGKIKVA